MQMPLETTATETSSDASSPLAVADGWRQSARHAIRVADWGTVDDALTEAETSYERGLAALTEGDPRARPLAEGRAMCTVLRSDVELRHWRLPKAEAQLDAAYKAFKELGDGVIGAELWRLTARLAERQGRWRSAKAAWKRVRKLTETKDEVAFGDALVRLAEIEIGEGNTEGADTVLTLVDQLARDLDDDLLRARVMVVRAADLESRQEYLGAWDAWQDAQAAVAVAPGDFAGLLKLRMAGTAIWTRPTTAFRLVETGYEALVSAKHPDALGLAYHQLAVLALAAGDTRASALAAMGARRSRGGYDDTTRPVLVMALRQAGFGATAERIESGTDMDEEDARLERILSRPAEAHGLIWAQVGTEEAMLTLCGSIRRQRPKSVQIRVDGESAWLLENQAMVRHRATLTWDAPVDTLSTTAPALPTVQPTPPPQLRQVRPSFGPTPRALPDDPDDNGPITADLDGTDPTLLPVTSPNNVLLVAFSGVVILGGTLGLAVLTLIRLLG